jgi:hypothetical protein
MALRRKLHAQRGMVHHVEVGRNKFDSREEFTHVPFYFTDNLSELIPAFGLFVSAAILNFVSREFCCIKDALRLDSFLLQS